MFSSSVSHRDTVPSVVCLSPYSGTFKPILFVVFPIAKADSCFIFIHLISRISMKSFGIHLNDFSISTRKK